MAFKIVRRKLETLTPNDQNPRSIKDIKFQKLVANIETYPRLLEIRPIVIDKDGKILGGNMRYKAVQHLGWKDIPTINAEELTPEEMQAFIILDNQDFGEWDFNILSVNFTPEQLVQFGFEPAEVAVFTEQPGHERFDESIYAGLPEYTPKENPFQLMVQFDTEEERAAFIQKNDIFITAKNGLTFSCWFPAKERSDNSSVKFE